MMVVYDVTRPVGERVLSAMVRCGECDSPSYEPLDTEKVYTILMNSYQAGGGEGYDIVKENKLRHVYGEFKNNNNNNIKFLDFKTGILFN